MAVQKFILTVVLALASLIYVKGQEGDVFRLASYYTDHMVLQQEPSKPLIWGYAEIGAIVNVTFRSQVISTVAKKDSFTTDGVWRVHLPATVAGGPFTITFRAYFQGKEELITLQDVLFGDVWVCSGQSNMAFTTPDAFNATQVMLNSYKYPNIRLLAVAQVESNTTFHDIKQYYELWTKPDPGTLGIEAEIFTYFSAVCYMFGVQLFHYLGYPIGLISDNWGGTPIQAWSSPEVVASCPSSKFPSSKNVEDPLLTGPHGTSVLWNAMIHPILNFTIKGAIWYQGEANSVEPPERYACLFPAMIKDWRMQWFLGTGGQTSPMFPFGFVQLCTSNTLKDAAFAGMRWAQTADFGFAPNDLMPDVFMAVAVDLPDTKSPFGPIHPRYKQDVADRLALSARGVAYKDRAAKYQGPFPSKVTGDATRNQINITYQFANVTVKQTNDSFEVCCSSTIACAPNGTWVSAPITSVQAVTNQVILSFNCTATGTTPKSVRYLWEDMPCSYKNCTIYGKENELPGAPFILPIN